MASRRWTKAVRAPGALRAATRSRSTGSAKWAALVTALLVLVEVVKELPATLLLRPIGVETLSTLVYARANVSLFSEAALPALAIVLVGLVPVVLSTHFSRRRP